MEEASHVSNSASSFSHSDVAKNGENTSQAEEETRDSNVEGENTSQAEAEMRDSNAEGEHASHVEGEKTTQGENDDLSLSSSGDEEGFMGISYL